MTTQDLVERLRKRAYEIGVQGDLITDDLLEEAAECIEGLESKYQMQTELLQQVIEESGRLKSRLDREGK